MLAMLEMTAHRQVIKAMILKTSVGAVARMTHVLKMGEKNAKYSAAVAIRYGEDRFCDFSAQIRHMRHSQQAPTEIFRMIGLAFTRAKNIAGQAGLCFTHMTHQTVEANDSMFQQIYRHIRALDAQALVHGAR